MPDPNRITIPETAILELEAVEEMDWEDGVSLEELINWINQVVARFRPDTVSDGARSSDSFSTRSFRHYQTLGCIDPPVRKGQRVFYHFRHYLQGLLVRKLLWERVPSSQIATAMKGRSLAEYKMLLLDGINIVPVTPPERDFIENGRPSRELRERFNFRFGIEISLPSDRARLENRQIDELLNEFRDILSARR